MTIRLPVARPVAAAVAAAVRGLPIGWPLVAAFNPGLWNHAAAVASGGSQILGPNRYRIYSSAGAISQVTVPGVLTAGRAYQFQVTFETPVLGTQIQVGDAGANVDDFVSSLAGTRTVAFVADGTTATLKRPYVVNAGVPTDVVVKNISVTDVTDTALNITGQPQSRSIVDGNTTTFSVTVSAPFTAIHYSWEVSTNSGASWAAYTGGSGAITNTLTTAAMTLGDNGELFRCRVRMGSASNTTGQIYSAPATLTVTAANANPVAPTLDLGDLTVDTGLVLSSTDLLIGATDADGDTLTIASVTAVSGGTVSGTGPWTITPSATGAGSATVVISDGRGGSVNRTVTWLGVAAPSDTIAATLSGGGLGAAPTFYGADFRALGGVDGELYAEGSGTPFDVSSTGGKRRDDGTGEIWMNAGGSNAGMLAILWPASPKIGFFFKRKTRAGGLFNGASAPRTFGTASSDKPVWIMDGSDGDQQGFCDFTPDSHTGNGGRGANGNSVSFANPNVLFGYNHNWDWDGPNNTFGFVDLGADKASATLDLTHKSAVIPHTSPVYVGDLATDSTITVRQFDRAKISAWGHDGDNLNAAVWFVAGDDYKVQVLLGNRPHLGLCTDVEFIKPDAWTDTGLTLTVDPAVQSQYPYLFVRDRAGNWFSGQISGGAVSLVAGTGTKPALSSYLPDASAYTSGVYITSAHANNRRHLDSAITLTGAWAFHAYIAVDSYAAKKPLIGAVPSPEVDRIQLTTAGDLECRVNGVSVSIPVSATITTGVKGRLSVSGDGTTLAVKWTPANGSEVEIGSVPFSPGRAPQFAAILCSGNQYPAGLKVYALALEDVANQQNSALWRFQPCSTGVATKPIPDIYGGDCHAASGTGASYLAVGSTPTTSNGAFFVE